MTEFFGDELKFFSKHVVKHKNKFGLKKGYDVTLVHNLTTPIMKLLAAIFPFFFGLSSTDIIHTVLTVEVEPLHTIATADICA